MSEQRSRRSTLLSIPPAVLAVLAEGAWIGLLYALMQTARGEPFILDPISLALSAGVGLMVARTFASRLAGEWVWVAVLLVIGAGFVGWLASDEVRAILLRGDVPGALARHQGGFLAGLALLRGTSHAIPTSSERSLARLLAWGTPLLAVPLLIGQSFDATTRSAFEDRALPTCLLFVLSATLALALARVANMGQAAGFGWDRNRFWLAVAVLAALAAIVALPLAFFVGPAVRLTIALTLPPLLLAAFVVSLGTITMRAVTIVALVGVVVFALSRLALSFVPASSSNDPSTAATGQDGQDPTATLLTWLPILVIALILLVILIRRWLRRRPASAAPAVFERRWIERPDPGAGLATGLHWPWPRRRAGDPANAVEAYLAVLTDVDRHPDLARSAIETPAAHARRLRATGTGSLELELLAADYELARFGARPLSRAEDARAIGRWRRVRARLR